MAKQTKHPSQIDPKKKKPRNYINNADLLTELEKSHEKGKMTDNLVLMLQELCRRYGKKGTFVNYCVDSATSALTKQGWKDYSEITKDDQILSYDITSGEMKWSKILDLYINEYDGYMHHLTTQGLDALVTPNHKFVSVESGIKPVEDIICNEHIVLIGDHIPDLNPKVYDDAFVRIVGWSVTEGHYSKKSKNKHSIHISQKRGKKANSIRQDLKSINIPYREHKQKNGIVLFHCTGEDITRIHSDIAPNRIPSMEFILSLTHEQRIILIETMVAGDGWFRPNKGMSYIQKDKNHIDSFLALCTLSGLTTSSTLRGYKTPPSRRQPTGGISDVYTVNIYASPKKHCKAEWIDFHGGKQSAGGVRKNKPNIPTHAYKGIIWCPQTEHGTWICKRNGSIYVTGNTYNEDMQAYAMMMLVKSWYKFNKEKSSNPFAFFTQCVKNFFRQYLNQEKKHRDIRDACMVDVGLTPSYTYQLAHESNGEGDSGNFSSVDIVISAGGDDIVDDNLAKDWEKQYTNDQKY